MAYHSGACAQKEAVLRAASFESRFVFLPSTSSCSQSRRARSRQVRPSLPAPDNRSELRVPQREPLNMLRDGRIAPCPQLQSQVAWSGQPPLFEQRDVSAQYVD